MPQRTKKHDRVISNDEEKLLSEIKEEKEKTNLRNSISAGTMALTRAKSRMPSRK